MTGPDFGGGHGWEDRNATSSFEQPSHNCWSLPGDHALEYGHIRQPIWEKTPPIHLLSLSSTKRCATVASFSVNSSHDSLAYSTQHPRRQRFRRFDVCHPSDSAVESEASMLGDPNTRPISSLPAMTSKRIKGPRRCAACRRLPQFLFLQLGCTTTLAITAVFGRVVAWNCPEMGVDCVLHADYCARSQNLGLAPRKHVWAELLPLCSFVVA
jgi:hypothetical protein